MNKIEKIFKTTKPVIGMLHLGYFPGSHQYKGMENLIANAKMDIENLQNGGVDGILIEKWGNEGIAPFVESEVAVFMPAIVQELKSDIKVPFGVGVLNNDHKVALSIAAVSGASFIQMDVFVDHVKSDFKYNKFAIENPFEVKVDTEEVISMAKRLGLQDLPIVVFVQPKHYTMLELNKPIELSVKQAIKAGAGGVLITKETGVAPTLDIIKRAKKAAGEFSVGVGSGVSEENIKEFLAVADFAVIGSAFKYEGDVDNKVELVRVKRIMDMAKSLQLSN